MILRIELSTCYAHGTHTISIAVTAVHDRNPPSSVPHENDVRRPLSRLATREYRSRVQKYLKSE